MVFMFVFLRVGIYRLQYANEAYIHRGLEDEITCTCARADLVKTFKRQL